MGEALSLNARLYPDRPGARDLSRSMTFGQWDARSCRLANALLGLGLAKGDRVAILAYNCVEWLEIYAATAKAGLIMVPVNFRLLGADIAYIVENSEASASSSSRRWSTGSRESGAGCRFRPATMSSSAPRCRRAAMWPMRR